MSGEFCRKFPKRVIDWEKGDRLASKNKRRLDLRGLLIPFTLLKVSQAFREIKAGETLEVLWGEPQVPGELYKVLPEFSYEVVLTETLEPDCSCRVLLRKKAYRPSQPPLMDPDGCLEKQKKKKSKGHLKEK
jgi:TusA-related sulfurtransferase